LSGFTKDIIQEFQSFGSEEYKIRILELIEQEICNALADTKDDIRDMCSHILSAGGKRIRPLLVVYSGLLFSELSVELMNAAVASEFIHMASLIHDDIIDNSSLRRGKPSINNVWGNHYAVLCGDYLFARAFGILATDSLIKSMEYMVDAIKNMCEGEIQQAGDRYNYEVNVDRYYERIAKKTAIFLKDCCLSGSHIGGAGEAYKGIIGDYGLNFGLAYQILDDILDFCGDPDSMGKPKYEDLSQGNATLPVILLLADEKYRLWAKNFLLNNGLTEDSISEISKVMWKAGVFDKALIMAENHTNKAAACLDLIPGSRFTGFLLQLIDAMRMKIHSVKPFTQV